LQRAKGDFVEHAWIEELHVRVLKKHADSPSELEKKVLVSQSFFRDGFSEERDLTTIRESEPSKQAKNCGFARSIRTHQSHALALPDVQ
jgi:hypothetical protein